jgi:hypothetical protein
MVGPVVLNIWSAIEGHDWWVYFLPWVLDIGTALFLGTLPGLVKDEWNYLKYNNQLTLKSSKGMQSDKLMLQKNNTYICHFGWRRKK